MEAFAVFSEFGERLEKVRFESVARDYLGPSSIGHPCERKLWMDLHENAGKIKRYGYRQKDLFGSGHREEPVVVELLHKMGYVVDEKSSNQEFVSPIDGFKGHVDGILYDKNGDTAVLEIKLMKHERFVPTVNKGVKEAQFQYWIQTQCYMGMAEAPLTLFLMRNRNTLEIAYEYIHFEPEVYDQHLNKFRRIKEAKDRPLGLSTCSKRPPQCSWCLYRSFCWKE